MTRRQLPAVIRQTCRLPDGGEVQAELRLVRFRHVAHPRYRVRVEVGGQVLTAELEVDDALGFVDEVLGLVMRDVGPGVSAT